MNIEIETCSFEDIRHIWSTELWPARKSAIEPCSAMKWQGGLDMTLMSASPTFWRARISGSPSGGTAPQIVGVLSGHFGGVISIGESELQVDEDVRSFRTRGLWVAATHRRQGTARLLMNAALEQAKRENCAAAWTFPRQSSMPFYESLGFVRIGPWIGENDPRAGEFGPNAYALKTFAR